MDESSNLTFVECLPCAKYLPKDFAHIISFNPLYQSISLNLIQQLVNEYFYYVNFQGSKLRYHVAQVHTVVSGEPTFKQIA